MIYPGAAGTSCGVSFACIKHICCRIWKRYQPLMKKYFVLLLLIITAQLLFAQQDCNDITGDITPVNPSICEGGSVQLTATGGSSYEWRRNNEIIEGVTGNTFNATQAGTYSVIIIEGECAVPATNTTTVTVNPLPSGNISPNGATICAGGSQQLTATGGTSYTWFLNGSEIVGETGAVYNATQAGTYTAIINAGGCSAPASNSVVVELITTPTGTISPAAGATSTGRAA